MDSDRFRELLAAPGPFASVYFEDSDDDDDPSPQLQLTWRTLRNELEHQGAAESITAAVEHAVMELRLPIGRGGRAVVATADGVILNEHLLRPTARPVVRLSELPYVVPILEFGVAHSDYLLVVADGTGAIITSHLDAARTNLLAALAEPIRKQVTPLPIADRRGGYDFEEIQRAIDSTLLGQRQGATGTAAARFTAELDRQSGLADEALPLFAISAGAAVVRTDERIAPADGIGAILRCAPTPMR